MSGAYSPGDRVRVRQAYPPGHIRTPHYIRGKEGEIAAVLGAFPNPEELAYGRDGLPEIALYQVRFRQADIWPEYTGAAGDTLDVDIYEHWLQAE